MKHVHRHSMKDQDHIVELYEMLKRDFPTEKIADWMAMNGLRYSAQAVQRTFRKAGREDLVEFFIKEEDIKVGDSVRSRYTARFGKVIAMGKDEGTITVKWDSGGSQIIDKHLLYKMREGQVDATGNTGDLVKVKNIYDNYGDIEK